MKKRTPKTFGITHTRMPITPELLLSKAGRKLLRVPKTDTLLNQVEIKARLVLRKYGLDDNWAVHLRKKPADFPDEQAFHAVNILAHLSRIRQWIKLKKTKVAVLETIHMMNAVADSMITVLEPDTYRGVKLLESSSLGGTVNKFERTQNYARWQKQAEVIWKASPGLSILKVANQIAKDSGEKPETIRRYIKKP